MKTPAIIEGLAILQKYRDNPDGFYCGAEHDELWASATDRPLSAVDVERLLELQWFQPDAAQEDIYNPDEGWSCFT